MQDFSSLVGIHPKVRLFTNLGTAQFFSYSKKERKKSLYNYLNGPQLKVVNNTQRLEIMGNTIQTAKIWRNA